VAHDERKRKDSPDPSSKRTKCQRLTEVWESQAYPSGEKKGECVCVKKKMLYPERRGGVASRYGTFTSGGRRRKIKTARIVEAA